ncbi:hypothetical protein D3C78_1628150 [compost metagenome]
MDEFFTEHVLGGFAIDIAVNAQQFAAVFGMPHHHAHGVIAGDETAMRLNIAWDVDGFAVAIGQVDLIVTGCHESVFRTLCLSVPKIIWLS